MEKRKKIQKKLEVRLKFSRLRSDCKGGLLSMIKTNALFCILFQFIIISNWSFMNQ